jgi:hypothetical protein
VGGVVVDDEMDVQIVRHGGFDGVEELPKLGRPVPTMALPSDFPGLDAQRSEERRGPVAHVIVRPPLDLPRSHRQQGLAAIQRLDLRFLVPTEHERAIRRIQIEPDDVPHFVDQDWIAGQFERLAAMGLEAKHPPDATDRALTQATARGHRTGAPVRRVARCRFERQRYDPLDLRVDDGSGRAWPRLIEQAVHAFHQEPLPPLADGVLVHAQLARDGAVRLSGAHSSTTRARWASACAVVRRRAQLWSSSRSSSLSVNGGSGRPGDMRVLLCTGEGATDVSRSDELRTQERLEAQRATTEAIQRKAGVIIPVAFHRYGWDKKGQLRGQGYPIKSFYKAWKTACRAAGCPGRIVHDFRRTAVRNLERGGVPRSTAMRMVGHRTMEIYDRYAITDHAMLQEGSAKLAAYLEAGASAR